MKLYSHPLAAYCQKVIVALYELEVPFTPVLVDLTDPAQKAELAALWPLAKFPVLVDGEHVVPESTIIIEHLDDGRLRSREQHVRIRDRFYDNNMAGPMQAIVSDMLRPAEHRDAYGRARAEDDLRAAYDIADRWLADSEWAAGDTFSLADCAAAPPLLYCNELVPIGDRPHLEAYYRRLRARPSFARVVEEALPFWPYFPGANGRLTPT